tara:strand:+ start:4278 stop:5231 length:954 start_codon:yes stop_codon:yes gene_type:complete
MPKTSKPRAGSLQYWPRKKARKFLPSVNWKAIDSDSSLLGFISYKVGMTSCVIKDNTENSLTKDKRIVIPVSILEVPSVKIFSIRFYKDNKVMSEIIVSDEKELKKKVKLPKTKNDIKKIDSVDADKYEDVRIIIYSQVSKTGIKKTPDLIEVGLGGSKEDKIKFIKNNIDKEILFSEIFKTELIDVRGLTKGQGLSGTVKRFGVTLKSHKSEKGVRRPGNVGPWHPAHVTFRVPMAGQLGLFTRTHYNHKIINYGKTSEKDINPKSGWKNYGNIKNEYIILQGSIQGPAKRQLLLTIPLRPTKKQLNKNYEFVELI